MNSNLTNILLGILALSIGLYIFKITRESFNNPAAVSDETRVNIANIHIALPAIDPKLVETIKSGIKNIIKERPDIILSIKQVLADPLINKTLADILYQVRS